jgi:hypothetical protein
MPRYKYRKANKEEICKKFDRLIAIDSYVYIRPPREGKSICFLDPKGE